MNILAKIKEFSKEDRVAIKCDGEYMTYKQLEESSEAIASFFIEKYSRDKRPVVIHGNKENLVLVAMISSLKSGRAYIPLDVTYPVERVKQILEEVKPAAFINFTNEEIEYSETYTMKDLNNLMKEYCEKSVSSDNWVKGDENAYILFTSGSTGKPKGVQISKNNLDSFIDWFSKYLNIDNINDVMMNQVSYSFDVSVIPIYIGLINGKTLNSLSKTTLEDFKALFTNLKESQIKTWVSTPALAEMCIKDSTFNKDLMPNLKTFFFAGEVLSKKLVQELMDRFPNVRVINGYGPTEGTVLLTAIDVNKEIIEDERAIPIGYPMEGSILKILDKEGKIVGDGEKGELIALGNSISKGYFNNEDITKKMFFEECVNGIVMRGYKTGDLAYFEEGIIHYCGRIDFQIKLNGFRIELEDIENNLRKCTNVNNCVVFPVYKNEKISHLISFITLEEDNGLTSLKNSIIIKNELKRYIPSYMIPRNIKILKGFPLNINGKIDRKKLMEEIK